MPSLPSSRFARPIGSTAKAFALIGLLLALAGCRAPAPPVEAEQSPLVSLAVPGHRNEHVSLASSGSITVALWAVSDEAGTTDIYSAVSRDNGRTFDAPVRVNQQPGDARANGEQPPRVTLRTNPAGTQDIVALWLARRASGSVMLTASSSDAGKSYGPTALVSGTDTVGNRGWQGLASNTHGIFATWLDHRRMAAASKTSSTPAPAAGRTGAHQHGGASPTASTVDSVAMAQMSDIYFADVSASATAPRAIAPGVCYCCKTAIAAAGTNALYLAWRHVYPGNMRDIAFVASTDNGRSWSDPVRVSEDGWSVAGCPDDGPAMATDNQGRVHLVWPTVTTTNGVATKAVFYAMTRDGRTFSPRIRVTGDTNANHPQIAAMSNGSVIVMWDETPGETRVVRRSTGALDATGAMTFHPSTDTVPVEGRYPTMAATPAGILAAWISGDSANSVVRTALLTSPGR